MSLLSELQEALAPIGLPIARNTYTGTAPSYIVLNYSTIPTGWLDDKAEYEKVLLMVHLYAPVEDSTETIKAQIKRALIDAGYSRPTLTDISDDYMHQRADKMQHLLLEAQKEVYVDGDNAV